jgi:hypothetical protein
MHGPLSNPWIYRLADAISCGWDRRSNLLRVRKILRAATAPDGFVQRSWSSLLYLHQGAVLPSWSAPFDPKAPHAGGARRRAMSISIF